MPVLSFRRSVSDWEIYGLAAIRFLLTAFVEMTKACVRWNDRRVSFRRSVSDWEILANSLRFFAFARNNNTWIVTLLFYHAGWNIPLYDFSNSQYGVTIQSDCLLVIFDGRHSRLSSWELAKADWLDSPKGFFVLRQGFQPAEIGRK